MKVAVRMRPPLKHRRRSLPWLFCLHCRRRLIQVDVRDNKTCVPQSSGIYAVDITLMCDCGHKRRFRSVTVK